MGLFYFAFCAVNHLLTFFVPINHLTSFVHLSLRSQAVGAETSSLLARHQLLELSLLFSKWGTTFNGCQGLTVEKLGLNLRREVFSHGQLYSAVTRVPDSEKVLVLKYKDKFSTCTTNMVWNELLL